MVVMLNKQYNHLSSYLALWRWLPAHVPLDKYIYGTDKTAHSGYLELNRHVCVHKQGGTHVAQGPYRVLGYCLAFIHPPPPPQTRRLGCGQMREGVEAEEP